MRRFGAALVGCLLLLAACSDSKGAPELALPAGTCEIASTTTSTNGNPSVETVYRVWDWCEASGAEDLEAVVESALRDEDFQLTGDTQLDGVLGTEFVRDDATALVLPARSFLAADFGGIQLPEVQKELRSGGESPTAGALILIVEAE